MANGIILGMDTVTQGVWIGKYGAGYWSAKLAGGVTPSWITSYSFSGYTTTTLGNPNPTSYLQTPGSTDSNTVIAFSGNNGYIDLTMADNGVYVTSLYLLSSTGFRRLSIKLQDPTGTTTYSTFTDPAAWSSVGRWYRVLHWGGDCRLRIESVSGTVPLCGVTFDKFDNQFGDVSEGL